MRSTTPAGKPEDSHRGGAQEPSCRFGHGSVEDDIVVDQIEVGRGEGSAVPYGDWDCRRRPDQAGRGEGMKVSLPAPSRGVIRGTRNRQIVDAGGKHGAACATRVQRTRRGQTRHGVGSVDIVIEIDPDIPTFPQSSTCKSTPTTTDSRISTYSMQILELLPRESTAAKMAFLWPTWRPVSLLVPTSTRSRPGLRQCGAHDSSQRPEFHHLGPVDRVEPAVHILLVADGSVVPLYQR